MFESYELVGGPQDGAKIKACIDHMPQTIYVGSQWLGDGYAAWGFAKSNRFPCRYVLDGYVFVYRATPEGGDAAER